MWRHRGSRAILTKLVVGRLERRPGDLKTERTASAFEGVQLFQEQLAEREVGLGDQQSNRSAVRDQDAGAGNPWAPLQCAQSKRQRRKCTVVDLPLRGGATVTGASTSSSLTAIQLFVVRSPTCACVASL
ncbi:hypothetical protein NUW54_g14495 [Trametes sanguinea]|uniref:Uncharacterized protein n=1 Tax=Trametes sanguinea TaxID=158606 RepID=A0ACC1MC65_9APHY|nr:hypothetical protein NUW54_g14495 [Trametes sanguinea]